MWRYCMGGSSFASTVTASRPAYQQKECSD
jgi:hypothetical protein